MNRRTKYPLQGKNLIAKNLITKLPLQRKNLMQRTLSLTIGRRVWS